MREKEKNQRVQMKKKLDKKFSEKKEEKKSEAKRVDGEVQKKSKTACLKQDKNEFLFDVVLHLVTRFSKMLRLIEPKIVVTVAFAFPSPSLSFYRSVHRPPLSIFPQKLDLCVTYKVIYYIAILYAASFSQFLSFCLRLFPFISRTK